MIKKLKIVSFDGIRPEIIRLSRVLAKLDEYCEHILVHTEQNYDHELNQVFFDDLGVRKLDYFLNSAAGSSGVAHTIGNPIVASEVMQVFGDTNSCLSVRLAKRRKIPIFYMEASNCCFDQRVSKKTSRRIVGHTDDVSLTYHTVARDYLLREGMSPDVIIKTCSSMFEASESFTKLVAVINAIAQDYQLPVIASTHPRTQKRIDATRAIFHLQVRLLKPLRFYDYVKLQLSAKAVLSDSGTINEESSTLNFSALNLQKSHERPEGMKEVFVMMAGLEIGRARQALDILNTQKRGEARNLRTVADYSMLNVSDKVVRITHSYTYYMNRVVWKTYA